MDSTFEVFYFPFQMRAEPARLLLEYAGAKWSNKFADDWANQKFNTPGLLFKQVPMLIEKTASSKEFRLVQSSAIIHYIVETFGLATECKRENAHLFSYYEGLEEVRSYVFCEFMKSKPEDMEKVAKNIKEGDMLKNILENNENILKSNGSNGFYNGSKITFVDLEAFTFVETINGFPGLNDVINEQNAPNLMKVYNNVAKDPKIIAYKKSDRLVIHSPFNPTK